MTEVRIKVLPHGEGLPLPTYATEWAAGLDLSAAEAMPLLYPGARCLVPTGVAIELPKGFEAQVRPRSGVALNNGITVLNSPGTIDGDYRGEIKVILINLGELPFKIERGDRIAQLVVARYAPVSLVPVDLLTNSTRGEGGFGSTGVASQILLNTH